MTKSYNGPGRLRSLILCPAGAILYLGMWLDSCKIHVPTSLFVSTSLTEPRDCSWRRPPRGCPQNKWIYHSNQPVGDLWRRAVCDGIVVRRHDGWPTMMMITMILWISYSRLIAARCRANALFFASATCSFRFRNTHTLNTTAVWAYCCDLCLQHE